MRGRAADNWRPLLAIADELAGDWPERARNAAKSLSAGEDDQPKRVQLLSDMRDIFEVGGIDRIASADLVAELARMEDRPWPEWRDGKPITKRQAASLLKPFEIQPRTIRIDSRTAKGYLLDQFHDSFGRYLTDRCVTTSQASETEAFEADRSATGCESVADQKDSAPPQTEPCDAVTDQHGASGVAVEVEVEF